MHSASVERLHLRLRVTDNKEECDVVCVGEHVQRSRVCSFLPRFVSSKLPLSAFLSDRAPRARHTLSFIDCTNTEGGLLKRSGRREKFFVYSQNNR